VPKRSLLTESAGIALSVLIDGANRHDMKLLQRTLEGIMINGQRPLKTSHKACVWIRATTLTKCVTSLKSLVLRRTSVHAAKRPKPSKKEAGFKARRWVVERTHSWMDRLRRILVRWEKPFLPCCT
jgi:putative transposase